VVTSVACTSRSAWSYGSRWVLIRVIGWPLTVMLAIAMLRSAFRTSSWRSATLIGYVE
jgi:hypothetical protein